MGTEVVVASAFTLPALRATSPVRGGIGSEDKKPRSEDWGLFWIIIDLLEEKKIVCLKRK